MIPIKTESAWKGTSDCRNCGIRDMVLFADLNEQDFGMIHSPIDDLEFRAGTILFAESTAAMGIFTLRTGMIKLVRVTPDGRQRIVRVLRPGDVAGLEALATSQYDSDAVALTDISVCRIPLSVINMLGGSSARLHRRHVRLRLLSRPEAGRGHDHPHARRPARAHAPGDRARARPMGLPRRLRGSRRRGDQRGDP